MILWLSKMLEDFMSWSSSSYLLSRSRCFFTPIKKEHILIATGGGSGTAPGGTMTRQAHKHNNDTTYFRSYFVLLLQDLMAWVTADNPVEVWVGSTPPTLQEREEEGRGSHALLAWHVGGGGGGGSPRQ